MKKDSKIYIAGQGLVGSAIINLLKNSGYTNVIFKSSKELDLRNQKQVETFFENEKPEYVFVTAAKVGGISANSTYKAEFLYDNIMINTNIIHSAYLYNVTKLLFLGSSCIYPKHANQPMKESELLTGTLEPTNEPYALAKIQGIKMCDYYRAQYSCDFISCMPTNLYGIQDNFDLENSHVLPALIRKVYEAKTNNLPYIDVWGTGSPMREFLHNTDLADACLFLMLNYSEAGHINVGSGEEISIIDLTKKIMDIFEYSGDINFLSDKPDGTYRKLLDSSKINSLGWSPKISLDVGITEIKDKIQNGELF